MDVKKLFQADDKTIMSFIKDRKLPAYRSDDDTVLHDELGPGYWRTISRYREDGRC